MKRTSKLKILVYAPTPPPYAGPEISTDLLLRSIEGSRIAITHLRSNVRSENSKKGIFDLEGILNFVGLYCRFLTTLLKTKPDKVYFLLSSGRVGLLRDAVILLTVKIFGRKAIAHYRGGCFHTSYEQQGIAVRAIIRLTMKGIDCLIVQAEVLKAIFEGLISAERIKVLYNGLPRNGHLSDSRGNLRPFTFLFVGHLAFSKGFYELIAALGELRKTYSVRLLFAGEKRFSADNRGAITAFLSSQDRLYFETHALEIERTITRFVEDPAKHGAQYLGVIAGAEKERAFKQADAFVLPSYSEGFSMSVLEAMAHGLPVIVTRVGALQEIIEDGQNGLFVKAGDAQDLNKKMETLVRNRGHAREMGLRNAEHVKKHFAIETIASQFEEILAHA